MEDLVVEITPITRSASVIRELALTASPGEYWPDCRRWHKTMPGYTPTELVHVPTLAESLGVKNVWVKNEQERFGLPSFKIIGASWAVNMTLSALCGQRPAGSFAHLRRQVSGREFTLTCATDGNHGRAVARIARDLGLSAVVYVPSTISGPRIEAIRSEGAEVVVAYASYDETVQFVADQVRRNPHYVLISDTSWPGYEDVPAAVIAGYATIMAEIQEQLDGCGVQHDESLAVFAPAGVGALAAAVARHFRSRPRTLLATVEPQGADCIARSLREGKRVEVPGPHHSIMAGLNCGVPSLLAWRDLYGSTDAAITVGDDDARTAMRELADVGVESGESGAASLAGATAYFRHQQAGTEAGEAYDHVLILNTEGAADPDAYAATIVGEDDSFPNGGETVHAG
ncbi:diaminopropionate ammonia-lyase [Mycolicibacterium porcinum]|uniref:Diaminopropionate ammonia-lyase n=1 Tax=Mycolicibacterium porcinum TaxID=39693 RepID=A0ABV3VFT1_9MYCO